MSVPKPFENCSKAYIKVRHNEHGYSIGPANLGEFNRASGVGERLEADLIAMPEQVTLTSLAISMARIADDLETIGRIAFSTYLRDNRKRRSVWQKMKDKYHETVGARRSVSLDDDGLGTGA